MPRLIDFDKLMEQYDFYNEFAVHDLRYLKKECLPFVDAIPREWIERKLAEHWYVDYDIREMLDDWEKENEKGSE